MHNGTTPHTIPPSRQGSRAPSVAVAALYTSYQGEGPLSGQRHLFLRLVGCNMRCGYCDAPETLRPKAVADVGFPVTHTLQNPVPLPSLLEAVSTVVRSAPVQAVALTGGEPLMHRRALPFLLEGLKAVTSVPLLLETNGQFPEAFAAVRHQVDVLSADVKLPSVDRDARTPWEQRLKVTETLSLARPDATVYVKCVVNEHLDVTELEQAAQAVAAARPGVPWWVQPQTRDGAPLNHPAVQGAAACLRAMGCDVSVQPQLHVLAGLP